MVKIEGNEVKVMKRRKGWAGWVPESEEERQKFKKQVLCPEGSRAWVDGGQEGPFRKGWRPAAEINGTTTATRN